MSSYLVVGNVTRDLCDDSERPGGTAVYAAAMAVRLGFETRLLTAAAPADVPAIAGVTTHVVASPRTTTFRLDRDGHSRRMWLVDQARALEPDDIPPAWRSSDVWHLAPVFHELDARMPAAIPPSAFVGLTPQGLLRKAGTKGEVVPAPAVEEQRLAERAQAIVISDEDIPDAWATAQAWADAGAVVVVTEGRHGSDLFAHGRRTRVDPFPARVVDDTGAGDVYATALFGELYRGVVPEQAVRFASAAASLATTGDTLQALPSRAEIEHRLAAGSS